MVINMEIKSLKAIDTHTHINHGSPYDTKVSEIYTATLEELLEISRAARIEKMFCSTFPSVLSTEPIIEDNEYLFNLCQEHEGLYQWVVIEPRIDETFKQARRMLNHGKCVGIKLHPSYHKYPLKDHAKKIFSFASEFGAIVQIHPDIPPSEYVEVADEYPDVTFIFAHLGSVPHVDAIERAKHRNIYTDTSGGASVNNRVIEYAVERVGSDRILFGTDTYASGFQRGRIEYALISDEDKINILRSNAERLFENFLK